MLGEGRNTVRIVDRITGASLATPTPLRIQWGRARDKWSQAAVQFPVAGATLDLGSVRSLRHEVRISRDGIPVWRGPVVRIKYGRTRVELVAFDLLVWLSLRVPRGTRTLDNVEPTRILGVVLSEALSRFDRIPVRPSFTSTNDVASLSWDFADRQPAWSVLRKLLAAHLDVTMVDDVLHAGATTVPAGVVATIREEHIVGDVDITEDGMQTATIMHATGAGGLVASWPPEPEAAPRGDDYYGVIDGTADRNESDTAPDLLKGARKAWTERRHPPVFVDMPSGARLRPTTPIDMAQLIPGAEVQLVFADRVRPIVGSYAIATVDVAQGAGSGTPRDASSGRFLSASDSAAEVVQVGLVPYGAPDE